MSDDMIDMGSHLMLVALANCDPRDLTDRTRAACYPAEGLMLRQSVDNGSPVDVFVEAGTDLLDYANLEALSILKPVCLPIRLRTIRPGRIDTRLRTDPLARRLADTVHEAIASLKPARR